jgi:GTP-sensing pleiotropic transcriptional regulator CodY
MLRTAQEIGIALQRSNEGLKASQDSFDTQQSLARLLDVNAAALYEKAKVAMASMNEDEAKKILLERQQVQEKLKKVLLSCVEEKARLETMQNNINEHEQRALEIESLFRRNIGAKALQDPALQFSLPLEDPLLQKFRDMGID